MVPNYTNTPPPFQCLGGYSSALLLYVSSYGHDPSLAPSCRSSLANPSLSLLTATRNQGSSKLHWSSPPRKLSLYPRSIPEMSSFWTCFNQSTCLSCKWSILHSIPSLNPPVMIKSATLVWSLEWTKKAPLNPGVSEAWKWWKKGETHFWFLDENRKWDFLPPF